MKWKRHSTNCLLGTNEELWLVCKCNALKHHKLLGKDIILGVKNKTLTFCYLKQKCTDATWQSMQGEPILLCDFFSGFRSALEITVFSQQPICHWSIWFISLGWWLLSWIIAVLPCFTVVLRRASRASVKRNFWMGYLVRGKLLET